MLDGVHAVKIARYIAAGFCMAFGGIGTALGQGYISGKACESIGKRLEGARVIINYAGLSMLLVETSAVFAFVISLLLIYGV
jgi:F-type H+-transporting ATPase subunit c